MIIAALILLAIVAAIQAVDVKHSERGFAAGQQEGNEVISAIFGPRPKGWQLFVFNTFVLGLFASPAFCQNIGVWGAGMGLMTGLGARHVWAILQWRKLGF